MADPSRNLESILAALAQRPPTSTPTQGQSGYPAPSYPPPGPQPGYSNLPPGSQPPPTYQAPGSYPYPQPSSSGNLDLSDIKPVNSGTVSIQDAIARAKAFASGNGATPYERPPTYPPVDARGDGRQYRSSRSRSPPARRDAFRDNLNPYRDERRDDRVHQTYGRERSYSPGPRGRQGGSFSPRGVANGAGRDRSPMRAGDSNSETIQIESSLVGLIIGRQGENLRRVEGDSHCRVQFLPAANPDDQFRQCRITGPPARRAEAKAAINRIIEDSGMGAIARAGLDKGGGRNESARAPPPQAALKEGEDCMQIMVPDRTVGLIIGRGGETIRDLQERSGCHINIVGESKSVNGLRPVNLIGPPAAAARAKEFILEIVDSDQRSGGANSNQMQQQQQQQQQQPRGGGNFRGDGGPGGVDKINDAIYVPSEAVGMIIGKGGETIREMQNSTGCKINVSQSSGPGEVEREIGLIGSRDAINRAKQAIEDKVEAVRQKNSGGGGGGRGGRGHHRDFDNPNYGQPHSNQNAAGNPPAVQAPAGGDGQADPYAAYGGYNAYLALWYQAVAAQQASGQGGVPKPPGTS